MSTLQGLNYVQHFSICLVSRMNRVLLFSISNDSVQNIYLSTALFDF